MAFDYKKEYNTIKSVVLGDMQESKTSQYSMD